MSILDLSVIHQLNVYQTWHWYIFVLDLDPKDPILCSRKTDKYKDKKQEHLPKKYEKSIVLCFCNKASHIFPIGAIECAIKIYFKSKWLSYIK
jgi:hypothetical protein